jgi:hypothetical protein
MSAAQELKPDHPDKAAADSGLTQLLAMVRRATELDLRVAAPARVVTYSPATLRVDVALELLPVQFVEGVEVPQPPILIPQIPVYVPGGSSISWLHLPIVPGDTGLVVFTDRCLSLWMLQGGPLDPVNGRTHNLADAVFFPGVRNTTNPLPIPAGLDAATLEGPLVRLGAAGVEFALKGTALAATCAALFGILNIVPPASDPVTVIVLANANKAAILGLLSAIQAAVSVKVQVQ